MLVARHLRRGVDTPSRARGGPGGLSVNFSARGVGQGGTPGCMVIEYETKQVEARDEAIERGLLWLVHSVWLQGPLPLQGLVRLVASSDVSRRDARVRVERAVRRGYFMRLKTRAGWLFTLGERGRLALGLDGKHVPSSEMLELAFARYVAASVVLPGWRAVLLEAGPLLVREGEPKSQRRKREKAAWDARHAGQRGVARPYLDRAGNRVWLLVGLPAPSMPTLRRLVWERAGDDRVLVVTSEGATAAEFVLPGDVWTWDAVLAEAPPWHAEPLAKLLGEV